MTKEEQVDWLCRLRADLNNGVIFSPWNKEFTEAITGILEQEPLEVKAAQLQKAYNKGFEDCRQAVIDSLHSKFADGFDNDRWWNSMSVLYAINKVPSVNPQEPKSDVVDKIRAEMHATAEMHEDGYYYFREEWIDEIIDRYTKDGE